jgi:hypothetical protein
MKIKTNNSIFQHSISEISLAHSNLIRVFWSKNKQKILFYNSFVFILTIFKSDCCTNF